MNKWIFLEFLKVDEALDIFCLWKCWRVIRGVSFVHKNVNSIQKCHTYKMGIRLNIPIGNVWY